MIVLTPELNQAIINAYLQLGQPPNSVALQSALANLRIQINNPSVGDLDFSEPGNPYESIE